MNGFLQRQYPSRILVIEHRRIRDFKPILSLLVRWGPNVYPFTDEKIEEEWNHPTIDLQLFLQLLDGESDHVSNYFCLIVTYLHVYFELNWKR
jgi:hypothetical protein